MPSSALLFLIVMSLQFPSCDLEGSDGLAAIKNFYSRQMERLYQKTCPLEVDVSMVEVVVHKLADLVGYGDRFPSQPVTYLCSMYGSPDTYWEQFQRTELQGVADTAIVEIVLGNIRAVIRMCLFDYERVEKYLEDPYAVTLEFIKFIFVVSMMCVCNGLIGRMFDLVLNQNQASAKDKIRGGATLNFRRINQNMSSGDNAQMR